MFYDTAYKYPCIVHGVFLALGAMELRMRVSSGM
jgi:hypothetical protein